MRYLGDFPVGSTVYVYFDTFDGGTGASITMTGLAATDIEVYKNGSVTQRASDTGFTLLDTDGIDFDSATGIHGFSIDLSSNATSGFFTAGSDFMVLVNAVTIDGETVRFIAATFSIENRRVAGELCRSTITISSQTSFTLAAGTASGDDNAYVGCTAIISDVASGIQKCVGYISAYTGSTRTVTLGSDPGIFTMATGDNITILATSRFANVRAVRDTVQTAGDVTALVTTVDTVVDGIQTDLDNGTDGLGAIKTDTAAVLLDTAEIGAAGAGLTTLATASALSAVASDVTTIAADVANIDGSKIFPADSADFADIPFVFVSSVDHATPVTGASGITITRSLNGAAFGAVNGSTTVTEIGNGAYHIDANSADMAGPIIVFRVAATGGTPAAPDDAFVTVVTDAV